MVKKSLSDLIQEEAQKFTPTGGESAIEVSAVEVAEQTISAAEAPTQASEPTSSKRTGPTKADLEITVKELQETLQEADQKQKTLQQKIVDLQSTLFEQKTLAERLIKELDETKKTALHLAEANSQLIEENNLLKKEKENNLLKQEKENDILKQEKQNHSLVKAKEIYNPINYKKSHRSSEKLAQNQPDEYANDSAPMWLLD
jgi:hypothetical protein